MRRKIPIPAGEVPEVALSRSMHFLIGRIIHVRKERGITQRQLAKMIGISQSAVATMERDPDGAKAVRVFAALHVLGHDLVVERRNPLP